MTEAKLEKVTKLAINTLHSLPVGKVDRFKTIAQKYGVSVTDVAQAGQQYEFYDEKHNQTVTASARPGKMVVRITSQNPDLSSFWNEFRSQT